VIRASRALLLAAAFAVVAAKPGAASAAAQAPAHGVYVEKVVPGFEAAKAGIQPGDVLVGWERAANPPASPAGARGEFRSPFDTLEVLTE